MTVIKHQNRIKRMKRPAAQHKSRWIGAALVAVAMTVSTIGSAQAADDTITMGWTSWADAKFMVNLVKQQVESHTSIKVNAQKLTIGVQYKAVANGDIDGMVMAWLPDTHKDYWHDYHSDVIDLGPMYTGAVVGWAVPDYVPEDKISSIADLENEKVADQFGHAIVGIDPGAGEMRESKQAIKDYDLQGDYTLKEGDEGSMIDALTNAIGKSEPIVVTLWTPHWAFAKWHLRFLSDPKHDFGGPQHVDVIVRKGFRKDFPEVAKFLSNLHVPLEALQEAMYNAHETSEEAAVSRFVKKHQALVDSWWFGTGAKGDEEGADATMSGDG